MSSPADPRSLKQEIRKQGLARRKAQPEKDQASRAICERFASLPAYEAADTVMLYVHMRDEVRTQEFLPEAIASGKRVIVPYCVENELELFRLESMDELEIGTWGILEPRILLRGMPTKRAEPREIDVIIVPGVAFDRRGGRLGHGRGYYDRLLQHVRPDATLAGVCYESQLFPEVPMLEYDVFMNHVLTEKGSYLGAR